MYVNCRPLLVSLDLSYNCLLSLHETVHVLVQLVSLRSVLLMGNPLSVIMLHLANSADGNNFGLVEVSCYESLPLNWWIGAP